MGSKVAHLRLATKRGNACERGHAFSRCFCASESVCARSMDEAFIEEGFIHFRFARLWLCAI
jgi:hypothetical protein